MLDGGEYPEYYDSAFGARLLSRKGAAVDHIRVTVVKRRQGLGFALQHRDPRTGKRKTESRYLARETGIEKRIGIDREKAEYYARCRERELNELDYPRDGTMTWSVFRARYEADIERRLQPKSRSGWTTGANHLERLCKPKALRDVNSELVLAFQDLLRDEGKSEQTIASYSRHLKAGLSWAVAAGYVERVPRMFIAPSKGSTLNDRLREIEAALLRIEKILAAEQTRG